MIFGDLSLSLQRDSRQYKASRNKFPQISSLFFSGGSSLKLATCLSLALNVFSAPIALAVRPAESSPSGSTDASTLVALEPPQNTDADVLAANRQLANILPAETPTAFFLSAKQEDWEALTQYELFNKALSAFNSFSSGFSAAAADIDRPNSEQPNPSSAFKTPASIFFTLPGVDYDTMVEPWLGDQIVIATLPDRTPRSIALTDLEKQTLMIAPVVDRTAMEPYLEALEASRAEPPEKSTYLGAQLWVWPTRTESFNDDYGDYEQDENWQDLPAVPHEDAAEGINNLDEEEPDYGTYEVKGQAVALVDGHLIFASDVAALKELLNYSQFNYDRLSDSELFLRSQYGARPGAIARIYGNLSEVSKFNLDGSFPGSALPPSPFPMPDLPSIPGLPSGLPSAPSLSFPQESQTLIANTLKGTTMDVLFYPQAEGLRLQGRVYGNNLIRSRATPDLPYADSALEFVPAPTYSLNSGRDVAGLWRQIAASLSLNPTAREFLGQARETVSLFTGLDLDNDIFGWMDREFVLFFFPSNQGMINSLSPGTGIEIGMAIQTSDRPTAQNTLDTIDGLVGSLATPTTINDTAAISWEFPDFSPNATEGTISYLSHGWVSEDTLIIASGSGAMTKLLNPTAFEPISEHPTFTNTTGSLASPNNGYSYVNTGSTFSLIYSLVSKWGGIAPDNPFFQTVKSYLGTIRGLGSTTSSTREYWQLDSLVNLAPSESSPSPSIDIEPTPPAEEEEINEIPVIPVP